MADNTNDMTAQAPGSKLSEKDSTFFATIMSLMCNPPEVDWDEVARLNGYKDGSIAKVRFRQIKKKALEGTGMTPVPSTPKKTPKSKSEVGSGTNTTPSKVRKPRGPNKKTLAKMAEAKAEAEAEAEAGQADGQVYMEDRSESMEAAEEE